MTTTGPARVSRGSHRAIAKPPRSRFGLIALLSALVLAAWVGFGPRTARPRPTNTPALSSSHISSIAARRAPRTKRIADVRVGDRVKAENPTGEEDISLGAEADPASWRKLVLRASKRDGSWADVELLRPLTWIEERGARAGGTALISVPECGIDGDADVLAIEPCPPIMGGRGRVVTGTFHHSSAQMMELHVDGLNGPIITTINHLFWSAHRRDYIRADALSRGERLIGQTGFMAVASVMALDRAIPVYNLEVHGAHVYHVSTAGILVHNSADNLCHHLDDFADLDFRGQKALGQKLGIDAADNFPELGGLGQIHHPISTPVYNALQNHPNLKGKYAPRDPRFTARAASKEAHNGYEEWHRQLDEQIAAWLKKHREATEKDFENWLREKYSEPGLSWRFPDGF